MTIQELLAGLETESNEKLKVVVFNVEDGEIAVYTRSDIDLKEYRGWENLRVAFWGVNGDRVIIHTNIEYGRPPKTEKRRMTCREWVVKHIPKNAMKVYGGTAERIFDGGCRFCPNEYEKLKGAKSLCKISDEIRTIEPLTQCEKCWSQPVPEGVEE